MLSISRSLWSVSFVGLSNNYSNITALYHSLTALWKDSVEKKRKEKAIQTVVTLRTFESV